MSVLNNNQVASILNEAFAQYTGADEIDTLDLSGIIDRGNSPDVIGSVEKWHKALMNVMMKRWFTDSEYRSEIKNPWFQDEQEFGAIVEAVSIEYPEVTNSKVWDNFQPTVDAQTGEITYVTIGTYEVRPLNVSAKHYGHTSSWEVTWSYSAEQYKTAFTSDTEMRKYINQMYLIVENAIKMHIDMLADAHRNGLLASKVAYAGSQGATGIHVVNLVKAYQESLTSQSDMTVAEFLNSDTGLRFATEEIRKYMNYLRKPSRMFNVDGKLRFIPKEREVVQILECFKLRLERVALTDAFHTEFASLPYGESVPFWQGFGEKATFDEVSKIDVQLVSGTDITQGGIVGLIADRWACMHTIKSRRNVMQYFQREDIYMPSFQFCDLFMIDDTQNAVVFVVEDYEAPGNNAGGNTSSEG